MIRFFKTYPTSAAINNVAIVYLRGGNLWLASQMWLF